MVTAPFDYQEMIDAADELLAEFGRDVKLIRTASTPTDVTKPWRGEDTTADTELPGVRAACVPWMSEDDADSVRHGVQFVIISATSIPSNDGETFDQMLDEDGGLWHLHDCDVIKPGPTRVLYVFKGEQ